MDATHSERSGVIPPADPWVGVALCDIVVSAQLLNSADEVVWRTVDPCATPRAAAMVLPVFSPDGEKMRLCFNSNTYASEAFAMHDVVRQESEHRARNIVSLALAIAHQSLGELLNDPVVDRFLDRLRSLDAVARAGREVEGDRCKVDVIARQIVDRFDDPQHRRMHLTGPPVVIPARWAHLIAIVLHELGTNAIRHGSLRQCSGEVQLRWCVIPNPDRRRCMLQLSWRETGGATVHARGPKGFGSRILRDIGSVNRRCNAVFNLLSTGLDYRLSIELDENEISYG